MSVFYRNGKQYGISDYSANNVTYDNSESGLEAVNTQDAIDKVKEKITDTFGTAQFRVLDGEIQWKAEGADTWNPFRANTLVGMDLEMVAHSQNTTTEATLTYTAEEEGFYLFVGAACDTGTGRTPSITPDTTATEVFSWCYAIQDGELLATTSKCNDLWFIILYKFNVGDAITITHKSSYNGSGDMLIFKVTLPSNYPSSVEIIDEARNIGIGDYEFIMTNTGTGTICY